MLEAYGKVDITVHAKPVEGTIPKIQWPVSLFIANAQAWSNTHSFLALVQHRFASHCCEALFLKAAPIVTQELIAPLGEDEQDGYSGDVYVSMENLFLYAFNELEGNLGYLMTDRFSSHPLRVLLLVLSGMPLAGVESASLLQSKKKEHVSITGGNLNSSEGDTRLRTVPDSFGDAVGKMITGTVAGLDTTSLRALATHPVANPVLQLLLEVELDRSGKQCAKDPNSLFRKLLPDDPLEKGTESAAFINNLAYDTVGSRLLEAIITHAPGKTFKALYRCSFGERLESFVKNEVAAFVVIKIIERLNKEDLRAALDQICPYIDTLIKRSRTSVIKTLIERCRIREIDTSLISTALGHAYGEEPGKRLIQMLKVNETPNSDMAEDRRLRLDAQDSTKVHGSLLAQCMLDSPGPLRELITEELLAMETPLLFSIAKDRTTSRVLQGSLTCSEQSPKFRRVLIPRFYGHIADLAADTVASHVIDSFWQATEGLTFIRERIADELAQQEASLRASIPGRAVWRNWKMDVYKTRKKEWLNGAKGQDGPTKTGIELARQRFAANKSTSLNKFSTSKVPQRQAVAEGKA